MVHRWAVTQTDCGLALTPAVSASALPDCIPVTCTACLNAQGREGALVEVTAHYAPHAELLADPHGGKLPGPPPGDLGHHATAAIQGSRGAGWNGDGPAMYPKGFEVGLSYPPMTYLTGERRSGETATHDQLAHIAKQVLGDGARRCWLYRGMAQGKTTWLAAFTASSLQADPVHRHAHPEGAAGKRLAALLVNATGGEHLDMGHIYGAVVVVGA